MLSTMPRLIASRATSAPVQWLTGNPLSLGFSQASAMMSVTCSGVNVVGAPGRGRSDNTSTTNASRSLSLAPSPSAAANRCCVLAHRTRHRLTRSGCTRTAIAWSRLFTPAADIKTIRARIASSCPVVPACPNRCRIRCCRSDTSTGVARFPTRNLLDRCFLAQDDPFIAMTQLFAHGISAEQV